MSLRYVALCALLLPACLDAKDDAKGVVDESTPPTTPGESGKADDGALTVAVSIESAHPYTNNFTKKYHLDVASRVPSCAYTARLHFSILRTELNYDFVDVLVGDTVVDSLDGTHDNSWSAWFDVTSAGVDVRLTTDGSITRHGFVVDQVQYQLNSPRCPPLVACPAGNVDVLEPAPACTCPAQPTCVPLADVRIDHTVSRRFLHDGHRAVGTDAFQLYTGPADGIESRQLGSIPEDRLQGVITLAMANGVLFSEGYDLPYEAEPMRELFTLHVGARDVVFAASQGAHTPEVAEVIAAFEALFLCDGADAALTCGDGYVCNEAACQPDASCICPEIYQPVCGVNGRTYGNTCEAGCAEAEVAHDGECGQVGDMCGGLLGLGCTDANKCRYGTSQWTAPYPDAAGACVARAYCDAPVDCNGLPAPAVLGSWACEANTCAFRAGPNWRDVTAGRFATAHPYANGTSVWKELTLPAEAQALRLVVNGSFRTERNYDFLEVWTWTNGAWKVAKRYSGTTGPALTDSFTGRYFYLRFVSDSSVTDQGFDVSPQWR